MTDDVPPLYSWRGHLAEIERIPGPADLLSGREMVEVGSDEVAGYVNLIEIPGPEGEWVVPWEDVQEHAEPVNMAAIRFEEETGP